MKVLKSILHIIDNTSNYSGLIISYFITPIFVLVVGEVIARYVFNAPTTWSNTLTQFIFGGYFVIGGAYCLLFDGHVKVDILYSLFSPRKRAVIDTVNSILFFAFTLIILYHSVKRSWTATINKETTGLAWDVIIWPYMWTLPIATFLLLLAGFAKLIRNVYIVMRGKPL